MMYSLSVIVPIYNTNPFLLNKCLDSLLCNFKYINEVLLIDSSENEDTKKVISKFIEMNSCFRLINSHKGVSHQRNVGLDNANCNFVAFVDSDDYLSPNYFKDMLGLAKESCADVIYPQLQKEILDDKFNVLERIKIETIDSPSHIDDSNFFVDTPYNGLINPVKLYKRDLIGKTRFREDICHGEDMIFNYELSKKGFKPVFCKSSIYTFTAFNNENAARKRIDTNFYAILKEMLHIYKIQKKLSETRNIQGVLHQYNYLFTSYYYECIRSNKVFSVIKLTKYRAFYLLHNFSFSNSIYMFFPFTRKMVKKINRQKKK